MTKSLRNIVLDNNKKNYYCTDKAGGQNAVEDYGYAHRCHEYAEFYDYLLNPLRNKEVKLLEIGIAKGGSIQMWREYFDKGTIYGVDNVPYLLNIKRDFNDPNIITFWENAYCDAFIDKLTNLELSFDVILDDGPHTLDSQKFFVNNYHQFLNDQGYMIIEDISGIDNARELHNLLMPHVRFSFIIDRTQLTGLSDEIILIGVK